MAWATPKTDWSSVDAVDEDDFNRIEGNIDWLNTNKVDLSGDTMTGDLIAAVPSGNQVVRNVLIGTSTPGSGDGQNGDIFIKY